MKIYANRRVFKEQTTLAFPRIYCNLKIIKWENGMLFKHIHVWSGETLAGPGYGVAESFIDSGRDENCSLDGNLTLSLLETDEEIEGHFILGAFITALEDALDLLLNVFASLFLSDAMVPLTPPSSLSKNVFEATFSIRPHRGQGGSCLLTSGTDFSRQSA